MGVRIFATVSPKGRKRESEEQRYHSLNLHSPAESPSRPSTEIREVPLNANSALSSWKPGDSLTCAAPSSAPPLPPSLHLSSKCQLSRLRVTVRRARQFAFRLYMCSSQCLSVVASTPTSAPVHHVCCVCCFGRVGGG